MTLPEWQFLFTGISALGTLILIPIARSLWRLSEWLHEMDKRISVLETIINRRKE